MIGHIIVGVIGLFAGGFGGYKWGASVEKRAAAAAQSLSTVANSVSKKI